VNSDNQPGFATSCEIFTTACDALPVGVDAIGFVPLRLAILHRVNTTDTLTVMLVKSYFA
jgi:hypothetical protein